MSSEADLEDGDKKILEQFVAEHAEPSADDVLVWARRHPRLATDFLELAADMIRLTALSKLQPDDEPSAEEVEAAWQRHQGVARAIEAKVAQSPRLSDLAHERKVDLADLADEIEIDRRILIALDAGRLTLPVNRRLVDALSASLKADIDHIVSALYRCYAKPKIAFANADGTPSISRLGYEDAVFESDMSEERKAFWTGKG